MRRPQWRLLAGLSVDAVRKQFDKSGLVLLYAVAWPGQSLFTRKPIKSIEDLKGMKFRVMQSDMFVDMVAALGANATPLPYGEVYSSIQTGVIDGAENNWPSYDSSGHFEVAKYYTLDEHTYVPDILLISKYVWDRLAPEQRDWLQRSVDESVTYQKELWKKDVQHALDAVTAAGVTVYRPDKTLFARKVEGMYEDYEGTDIGDLIRRIRAVE